IPLSPQLERVFRQRIGRLPDTAQTALLIAAADTTGDMPAVLRAMAGLGLPVDALDPAEGAGLARISGTAIAFRHPLVRSALYQGATLSQRQRVHAALAGAFTGEEHADRRVWHQALATLTGDEEVAAALEASARRSQTAVFSGDLVTAIGLGDRAADVPTRTARDRLMVVQIRSFAKVLAGEHEQAQSLLADALDQAEALDEPRALLWASKAASTVWGL